MQVHAYPYDAGGSTFIVEMHDSVWRRAGFDRSAARVFAPGESDSESVAGIGELLGDLLDGHPLLANNSRWITFTTVRCESWRHGNVVLLGDAAHTAHFSIGSGTKLAMEDALALAACLHEQPDGRPRAGRVRRGAAAGGAVHPAGGAGQPGVVREPRAVRAPGAAAVRLQPADPQPPGDATTTCGCGTRSSWPAWTAGSPRRRPSVPAVHRRPTPRRCSSRCGCGGWSWPTGWSSRRWTCTPRWTATRPTSTSSTSAARRSAGPGW